MQPDRIPIAYRKPFDFNGPCYVDERPHGESILEIVRSVSVLPAHFMTRGYVCINGEIVPRELWARVRPKPARNGLAVAVTLHVAMQDAGGGQGGGGKQIVALVAALALVVVTAGIGAGFAAPFLGASFAAGTFGAAALAGAVGIAGALAISALTAPPTQASSAADAAGTNAEQAEAAAAQGNVLDRGGAIPRVIGTRKVFPPLACEPMVELVDQDEVVEALFVLNGPHLLEDIRIEGNSITDMEDVDYETREGWTTDTAVTLVERQARTTAPQLELSSHSLQSDGVKLAHPALPESDLPVWHGVTSRHSPDQIWMHLLFPGGIYINSANSGAVPLRIRFRKRGDTTWINLPELHFAGNSTNQLRAAIKFNWAVSTDPQVAPPSNIGFRYAHLAVPVSTLTPTQWVANSYFDDGAGDLWLVSGNEATTRVRNIYLYDNRVEIFLDEGTFPKGMYEIQIKRGMAIAVSSFGPSTYLYAAVAEDFFFYKMIAGVPSIAQNHTNYSDRAMLVRLISIWNSPPLATPGNFSLIAIKAINRTIRQISVQASGYVKDWDGSGWNTWTTTSNPAPHYADVLCGAINLDPLPTDLRDDTALVAWRTLCNTNDWTCDAIVNDTRTQDVLNLLASCGYARPYQSDVYGVTVDNDRTADAPVQVFSRRNCANLRYERAFARVPAGFNVTYRDEDLDDDQAQVAVYQRDPANADLTLLESVTYDGLINVDKVTARAQFDLDQANLRSTFYYLNADIESIVCRRGSLVAVEHDILSSRAGDGYIVSKQTSAGNITGVTLDTAISITSTTDLHAVTNMHSITDLHDLGGETGIVIRRTDGTLSSHKLSNSTGTASVLTFTTPIADVATIQGYANNDRKYGCLVVAGELNSEDRRLLVQSIQPQADLTAQLTLVDEAPELVRG